LGEDVNGYDRVLIPKILRFFPPKICQRWIVHVKRQGLSEGDILKLMDFLDEEADAVLTAQKILREALDHPRYTRQRRRFTSTINSQNQSERTVILKIHFVSFVNQMATGLKNANG